MKYNPALDGVRAVAIISVMIYHAARTALPGGWAGVDIFFVLSGFLITSIIAAEIEQTGALSFKNFYIRRFLRILPAFLVLIGIEIVMAVARLGWDTPADRAKAIVMAATYLMNWNRAFALWPQADLGHTWSLSMEEQFYLLWPLLFATLLSKRPLKWIAIIVGAIVIWRSGLTLTGSDPERTYNGFDTHADSLMIGCFIALWKPDERMQAMASRAIVIPVLALAAIFLFMPHRVHLTQTIGLTLSAVLAGWIILGLQRQTVISAFLANRSMVYVGRISYSLYLFHFPLIMFCERLHGWRKLIAIPLAFAIAALVYHYVERPALRLKSRFQSPAAKPAA